MQWLKNVAWGRLAFIGISLGVSGAVGFLFQPMLEDNSDAVNTVVTIFSILAGFLIAVITFIAEPTLRQAQNWQELQRMRKSIKRRLFRHQILFYSYLITLGIALAMYLTPNEMACLLKWLQTTFLSLATFVFLMSFSLPDSLIQIQMDRYQAELEAKKPKALKDAESNLGQMKNDEI